MTRSIGIDPPSNVGPLVKNTATVPTNDGPSVATVDKLGNGTQGILETVFVGD